MQYHFSRYPGSAVWGLAFCLNKQHCCYCLCCTEAISCHSHKLNIFHCYQYTLWQGLGFKFLNISADVCVPSNMVSCVILLSLIYFEHVMSLRLIWLSFLSAREEDIWNAPFQYSLWEQRLLSEPGVPACAETPATASFQKWCAKTMFLCCFVDWGMEG